MAIKVRMDKVAKKREEEQREQAMYASLGRPVIYWKPKQGTNKIRLMPPYTEEGPNDCQFWCEKWVHYGVTAIEDPDDTVKFAVICPTRTKGFSHFTGIKNLEPCPVCAHVENLKASGDPGLIELAKGIRAKKQIYSNVIDLYDPVWTETAVKDLAVKKIKEEFLPIVGTPKVLVYGYGTTVFDSILDIYSDNVDVSDLINGHDLFIEREGVDRKTKYRVRPNLSPTPAPITEKELEKYLYDLDNTLQYFNYEQIDAILAGANYEDVRALVSLPAAKEAKQLEEGKKETKKLSAKKRTKRDAIPEPEDNVDNDIPSDDYAADDEAEMEAGEEDDSGLEQELEEDGDIEGTGDDFPPLDKRGNIEYSLISSEDIEDPENEKYVVGENSVYVACYGKARQRDENEESCTECALFEQCGQRIAELDEIAAKEEAAKRAATMKKGIGKKGVGKKAAEETPAPAGRKRGRPPKAVEEVKPTAKAAPKSAPKAAGKPSVAPKNGNNESSLPQMASLEDEMMAAIQRR